MNGYSNFVFVSGNGQPFAINAVNSFLLNMEKAYNKKYPEEAIPHFVSTYFKALKAGRISK